MTRVLGFCVTVTKALRTFVPFNYVGRLDSCLGDLVVGYQVKSTNRRESQEDCSTKERQKEKGKRQREKTSIGAFFINTQLQLGEEEAS